jgi:2-keto-4-pentenoate hydratase
MSVDSEKIDQAAALFVRARRTGVPIRELPEACRPQSAADSNAIIREVTRQLDKPVGGWKITYLFRPGQVPIVAPLFAENILQSPAGVPPAITHSLLIEPEIAFRVTQDLPRRAAHYRPEEVAECVAACPALELNDTRFDTAHRTIRQILDNRATVLEAHADHQTSGAFVVGDPRTDWRSFDFAAQRVVMSQGDRVVVDRVGGHALSDPFLPVVVLTNILRHEGGLKQGQVVATGSFSGFFPVVADIPVTVDFIGFGGAQATFCSR